MRSKKWSLSRAETAPIERNRPPGNLSPLSLRRGQIRCMVRQGPWPESSSTWQPRSALPGFRNLRAMSCEAAMLRS